MFFTTMLVFVGMHGLSLVPESRGCSLAVVLWLLVVVSLIGSRHMGSVVMYGLLVPGHVGSSQTRD